MRKKHINHKYLLGLYHKVNDFLTVDKGDKGNLPDIIVSFCTVVEKILKIKLHEKNPILVFDQLKCKDADLLVAITMRKEKNIETVKIAETVERFKLVFSKIFSDDELQALIEVFYIRNSFIHGYKPDDEIVFKADDVVKKIGTIWEKVSKEAASLFGEKSIKKITPKKKYSEEELEQVLIEGVKSKIKSSRDLGLFNYYEIQPVNTFNNFYPFTGEKCPRCGAYGFSLDGLDQEMFNQGIFERYPPYTFTDLYKCKKCNLELTKKEYEIAKKLNQ